MDVKNLADELKKKSKEVETLMKRKLPVVVGRMAKDHYQENFRKGGFQNRGLRKWPVTRRQTSGIAGADGQYGPLLSRRNHLFASIKYVPSDSRRHSSHTVTKTTRTTTKRSRTSLPQPKRASRDTLPNRTASTRKSKIALIHMGNYISLVFTHISEIICKFAKSNYNYPLLSKIKRYEKLSVFRIIADVCRCSFV